MAVGQSGDNALRSLNIAALPELWLSELSELSELSDRLSDTVGQLSDTLSDTLSDNCRTAPSLFMNNLT